MSSAIGITYEDVLFKKMRPQGVVFLSILVLEGPDIIKFIAPQEFMDVYLENQLYNQDPCLIVSQDTIGFYKWDRFIDGKEITDFIREKFEAIACESLVLLWGGKRLILTVGYKKEFSLSEWFFKENPELDHFFK